jgi:predicted ribonuclease YlaK
MAKKKTDEVFYGFELNEQQEKFREAIMSNDYNVIIADATAGSGKTLIAVACANILCKSGRYDSAVFVFPTVEEASLGYRPGNTTEKEADYLGPLYDALIKIRELPQQAISSDISEKNGTAWITARSATFMRGINLEKKVVIIDECQNMSVPIIKRIISRCYDNCKVIILGCQAQTDVPLNKSGFKQLIVHMDGFDGSTKCELPISYRGKLAMHIDKL